MWVSVSVSVSVSMSVSVLRQGHQCRERHGAGDVPVQAAHPLGEGAGIAGAVRRAVARPSGGHASQRQGKYPHGGVEGIHIIIANIAAANALIVLIGTIIDGQARGVPERIAY